MRENRGRCWLSWLISENRGHPIVLLSIENHKYFLLFDFNRLKHVPFSGRTFPYIFLIKFRRLSHSSELCIWSLRLSGMPYLRPPIIPNQDFSVQWEARHCPSRGLKPRRPWSSSLAEDQILFMRLSDDPDQTPRVSSLMSRLFSAFSQPALLSFWF